MDNIIQSSPARAKEKKKGRRQRRGGRSRSRGKRRKWQRKREEEMKVGHLVFLNHNLAKVGFTALSSFLSLFLLFPLNNHFNFQFFFFFF